MDLLQQLFGQGNGAPGSWIVNDAAGARRSDASGLGLGWAVNDPGGMKWRDAPGLGPGWPVADGTGPGNRGLNWDALPGVLASLAPLAAALGPQSAGGPAPPIAPSPVYGPRSAQPIQLMTLPEPPRRVRVPGLLGDAFPKIGGIFDD
jgi:hypothetical protein